MFSSDCFFLFSLQQQNPATPQNVQTQSQQNSSQPQTPQQQNSQQQQTQQNQNQNQLPKSGANVSNIPNCK